MSLLLKKLLIANVLGAGIITPIVKYTRPQTPIEQLELENTLEKWNQLFSKITGNTNFEKLSSLFSRNLTSFSKSAVVNIVKQLLMQWAIQIWENQEAFFPISQRLNKFFFYYHIHHWKMKNEVEELSWDLIKQFFIDFFFKEKGWFLLSTFGDFSSFVLKEWERREKPMKIYEWTLKYSNAGENKPTSSDSESLYDKSTMEKVKNKVPFLFPEIQKSEQYSSFISKLIHRGEVELNNFKKKWVTLSELTKLTDGYKLGALIHLFGVNKAEAEEEEEEEFDVSGTQSGSIPEFKLSNGNGGEGQDAWKPADNPLYLFLDKKENDNCLLIQNSLFKEKSKEQNGTSCLYSARWLRGGSNGVAENGGGGGQNGKKAKKQKVLASREQEGISFYYLSGGSKSQRSDDKRSIDEQDPEVIEKVTKYLTDNFETIFFQYLLSKKTGDEFESSGDFTPFNLQPINKDRSIKIKDWNFSEFLKKHLKVLKASSDYLESLYWAQTLKTLQTILLSVYKHTPSEIEFKKSNGGSSSGNGEGETLSEGKKIQLLPTSGLFSSLAFKRTGKPEEESKELDFFELRNKENSSEEKGHKNFFFDELTNFLFGKEREKDLFSLEEKASELKQLLSGKEDDSLFKDSSLKDLFLNNLFFRAQLEDFAGNDNVNSISSILALKAEEIIFSGDKGESEGKNSFSELLENYISSLKTKKEEDAKTTEGEGENTTWADLIKESVFLEPFLKSPAEKKILYGTLDIENSQSEKQEGEASDKQKLITKARNHWLLNNYYFSDSAYESSSAEYKAFLSYLLAVKWMIKNDYSNLPRLINYILKKNKNKNAYLLWFREITEEEKEKLSNSQTTASQPAVTSPAVPSGSATSSKSPQEQLKEFLKETFSTDISNPLLKSEFALESDSEAENGRSNGGVGAQQSSEAKKKTYSSRNTIYNIDAYKDKNGKDQENQNKLTQLSGFVGLVTESFETREIPQSLKDYIFKGFLSSNSSENTNYSTKDQGAPSSGGSEKSKLIEGAFFPHNTKRSLKDNSELLDLLKNVKKKEVFLKLLEDDKSLNSLRVALGEQEREINNLTLKKLKDELTKSLSESNTQKVDTSKNSQESKLIKELYKLFNRFSGYLYLSDGKEKSPYVFTETKESSSEKKYYIGFLYQVNQFDFEKEGIKELKQALSEKTLHTLISLFASNKEIREWIYEVELTKQLFLS